MGVCVCVRDLSVKGERRERKDEFAKDLVFVLLLGARWMEVKIKI